MNYSRKNKKRVRNDFSAEELQKAGDKLKAQARKEYEEKQEELESTWQTIETYIYNDDYLPQDLIMRIQNI